MRPHRTTTAVLDTPTDAPTDAAAANDHPGAPPTLREQAAAAHRQVRKALDDYAHDHTEISPDPRTAAAQLDTAVGLLSQHLDATEAVLLPAARHEFPTDTTVNDASRHAREMELTMRHIEQRIYGDMLARGTLSSLHEELTRLLEAHAAEEDALLRRLEQRLPPPALDRLSTRAANTARHGATRTASVPSP